MKIRLWALSLFIFLASCSMTQNKTQEPESELGPEQREAVKEVVRQPDFQTRFTIRPGEVKHVRIPRSLLSEGTRIKCREKDQPYLYD